jgi:hypothetical protein
MDLTERSETSAKLNLTPGKTPKENTQDSEHGETLKSRTIVSIILLLILILNNLVQSKRNHYFLSFFTWDGMFRQLL